MGVRVFRLANGRHLRCKARLLFLPSALQARDAVMYLKSKSVILDLYVCAIAICKAVN